jgi:hypothetical protein
LKTCDHINIFLISKSLLKKGFTQKNLLKNKPFKKRLYPKNNYDKEYDNNEDNNNEDDNNEDNNNDEDDNYYIHSNHTVIGYLALNKDNYLTVVIMEEYQNKGIATAMVAQFMEIYYARHYLHPHSQKIYIDKSNMFMVLIAKKLSFKLNKDQIYESDYKLSNNLISSMKQKILTYKIINSTKYIDFDIDKYMTKPLSNPQFIHFIYELLEGQIHKKAATGNKYEKQFTYQGAELKSTLDAKVLFRLYLFKLWAYKFMDENVHIFNLRISNIDQIDINKKYTIFNIHKQNYKILNGKELI